MNRLNTINKLALVSVTTILCAAGAAFSQAGGGFDRPLNEARQPARDSGAGVATSTFMSFSKIEGDQRYHVEIRDGEVSAKVNGREVPADRVRRDGERVEILDRRGDVLASFNVGVVAPPVPPAPPAGATGRGGRIVPAQPLIVRPAPRGLQPAAPDADAAPGAAPAAPALPPPRVMIGITMSEVPEALLEHLEIECDAAVMIDRVIDDLPAARAGLRSRDIIIEVDGKRPVTPAMIRESINRKDPGQTVEMKVIRRGQEQVVKLKLEKFDEARFAAVEAAREQMIAGLQEQLRGAHEEIRGAEEIRRQAEERVRRLAPIEIDLHEMFRERGIDGEQMRRFREMQGQRGDFPRMGALPEGWEMFVPMSPGGQPGRERLSQIEERMTDLERQVEGLADRLDEIKKALQRLGSDR